jgi:hypothetical protein
MVCSGPCPVLAAIGDCELFFRGTELLGNVSEKCMRERRGGCIAFLTWAPSCANSEDLAHGWGLGWGGGVQAASNLLKLLGIPGADEFA